MNKDTDSIESHIPITGIQRLSSTIKWLILALGPAGVVVSTSGAALMIFRQELLVQVKPLGTTSMIIIYWVGPILLTIAATIAALRYLRIGDHFTTGNSADSTIPASQVADFSVTSIATEVGEVLIDISPPPAPTDMQLFRTAIDRQSRLTRRRLTEEISALSRRGNLNLVIGMVISIVGICYLGWKMFVAPTIQASNRDLLAYFIPRATFTILIEAVAFFFLNLYRTSLHEIKYFQNELTNVEARLLAVNLMLYPGDAENLSSFASDLMKTERNFILQKGQTTVDLEREKLVGGMMRDSVIAFKQLLNQKAAKSE